MRNTYLYVLVSDHGEGNISRLNGDGKLIIAILIQIGGSSAMKLPYQRMLVGGKSLPCLAAKRKSSESTLAEEKWRS